MKGGNKKITLVVLLLLWYNELKGGLNVNQC